MKKLKLVNADKFVLVDDEDFERLKRYKWRFHNGYAVRTTLVAMHREIMNTPTKMQTDHRDMDKLNNQKSNLRNCTQSQNLMNRKVLSHSKCGVKGIRFKDNRWQVRLTINGKSKHFGCFTNKDDAAKKYNEVAVKYYGEFARLNEIG